MIEADANVVQKLVELAPPIKFSAKDTHGVEAEFTSKQVFEVKAAPPDQPETVLVNTLQGFADLILQKIDALKPSEYFIQVDSHELVTLNAKDCDSYGRRLTLIQAAPVEFEKFAFGRWLTQEEFVIAVASRFAETDDKEYVLRAASTLTGEAISVHEDDGFTQKVIAKAGMKVKEEVTLKPRVKLAPFRTFPECQQVISDFVFRAKATENGPCLMLIEADGGRWKIDAINEVRRFLATLTPGVEIVA